LQISYNQNRTEIRSINSMYDIYMNRGKIGNPPILLVYTDNTINVSDDEKTENEIHRLLRFLLQRTLISSLKMYVHSLT